MELKQYTEDLCYVEFNLFYFTWKYVGNMLEAKLAVLGKVICFHSILVNFIVHIDTGLQR